MKQDRQSDGSATELFAPGPIERRKRLVEQAIYVILLLTTIALVLPLVSILAYMVLKAWPALSWSLISQNPQNYMTAGGIWAPLVGTFYLVLISLAIAAPIGILAGVYLNEYASENWLTRIVNLAVVNLAGVPSIVHALFARDHDVARDYHQYQGGTRGGAVRVS
jgi:phosphate transport system permease protein